MDGLSISKLARAANVSADTVRYYERIGLMSPPPRAKSGYRFYSPADLRRLILIRHARTVGFSIDEIAELLALRPGTAPERTEEVIRTRLASIEARLAELQHWRLALHDALELHSSGATLDGFLLLRFGDENLCSPKPVAER